MKGKKKFPLVSIGLVILLSLVIINPMQVSEVPEPNIEVKLKTPPFQHCSGPIYYEENK